MPKTWPTLDLHGATREEVYDLLDQFIMKHQNEARVRVMPGKGKGIVKDEVIRYLKQARYPWEFEKLANGTRNEGALVVFVDGDQE